MAGDADLTGLVGFIVDVVAALGAPGVALLVALENIFPPIPSEVVLPFAGFVAGRDGTSVIVMILAATAGSVVGAAVLYELGRRFGQERTRALLDRLPFVEADEIDRAIAWFERHGPSSVFLGRLVPLVRSLVSLPAGAARMPRGRFLTLTAAGSLLWNAVWVWGGSALGASWEDAGRWSSVLNRVLAAAVAVVLVRYAWQRRAQRTA